MGKIKYQLKEYLSFSRSERNGIVVLVILIVLLAAARYSWTHFLPQDSRIDVSRFENEIKMFEQKSDSLQKQKQTNKFILVKSDTSSKPNKTTSVPSHNCPKIELNSADSALLEKLPGIGPSYARRIIKYRTILGGYYSLIQLSEVYGLKPETVKEIEPYLKLDTSSIVKIQLNTSDFKLVNAHPYISFEQTKAIFNLKRKVKISSAAQLIDTGIFTPSEMLKLKHYIAFN